jgi:hypothetical protein
MTTPRKAAKLRALSKSLVKRTLVDEPDNYNWCIYNLRCREEAEEVLAFIAHYCRETNVMFELQTLQELAIYTPTHDQWRTVRIKFAEDCESPNWHCYCSKTQ